MVKVKKAIITAAGYGTRFLPATKNVPKELIPIIDKPTISYVVERCVESGINEIIIVTRMGTNLVEDYFDYHPALDNYLIRKGKKDLAKNLRNQFKDVNFVFVRQDHNLPYGNAAPLYSVKGLINNEPFIYAYGDDVFLGRKAGVYELVKSFEQDPCDGLLMCKKATKQEISKIGAEVRTKKETKDVVEDIVEKPPVNEVKGNLLSVSPYLLTPEIFKYLNPKKDSKTGEFLIQKAILKVIKSGGNVRAAVTKGQWMTSGDPLNYLKTTVELALEREDLREDFLRYLKKRIK